MSTEAIEFVAVVVACLLIVGVVIEAWNLLEHRRENREDEQERQILRQRYGRRP